jgi:WASH complex subunit 7
LEEYAGQLLDIEDALDESLGDAWDYAFDPIALDSTPYEQATVLDLARTDNKVFNKVTIVFVTLLEEVADLVGEAKSKFYPGIILYGDGGVGDVTQTEGGDAQLLIARMLPFLQRLSVYVNRVRLVVKSLVQQLASLHSPRPAAQCIDPTDVHLETVFAALGRLLTVMVTLDEMIAQNESLQEHWVLYKRMMKSVRSNTDVFKIDPGELPAFETWILTLEGQLLDGMLFQNTIQMPFDDAAVGVSANPVFREEFTVVLRRILGYLEPRLGEPNEREHRQDFVGLCALFVFYNHLFRVVDKKLVKSLWDVQLKVPAIHLFGHVLLVPNEWISRKMPQILTLIDKKSADFDSVRREHLKRMDANIAGVAEQLYLNVCTWMVRMESPEPKVANIGQRKAVICQIYIQGILFAYQISNFVKTFLALHSDLQVPMKNSYVQALFRMTELLKAIEQTFHRRSMWIANHTMHIVQHFTFSAIQLIRECAQNVKERVSAKSLDVLTAMDFIMTALNGPGTRIRRSAIDLALQVASSSRAISPQNLERLQNYLRKLDAINTLSDSIATSCNCDFLYWYRDFYPLYLNHLYQNPLQAHRIHYFFACLRDCVPVLKASKHEESDTKLIDAFRAEIEENLEQCIVMPLCTDIETDLRLQIHTGVVRLDDRNPFKVELKDLTPFLKVNPIRFLGENFDIRTRVTHYLDTTFYNLTTVALHDWKVYGQMRHLATQKYGLDMQDV